MGGNCSEQDESQLWVQREKKKKAEKLSCSNNNGGGAKLGKKD